MLHSVSSDNILEGGIFHPSVCCFIFDVLFSIQKAVEHLSFYLFNVVKIIECKIWQRVMVMFC